MTKGKIRQIRKNFLRIHIITSGIDGLDGVALLYFDHNKRTHRYFSVGLEDYHDAMKNIPIKKQLKYFPK